MAELEPLTTSPPSKTNLRSSTRRINFIERTLTNLTKDLEYALMAEELAKTEGLLQKLDPRVKVLGALILICTIALTHQLIIILIIFLLTLILALLSKVPLLTLARRVWLSVLLFTGSLVLPTIFLTPGLVACRLPLLGWAITWPGLKGAILLLTRVEAITTLSILLVLTTLWTRILKALAVLGVPVIFIVILGITYRYIFLLLQTALDMFEARQSRLIGQLPSAEKRRLAAASVGVLLSKTFHLSNEVYLAMQARGFRGEVHMLDDFVMQPRDWVALIVVTGLAITLIWSSH